jgi:translation initiation factor IF-3
LAKRTNYPPRPSNSNNNNNNNNNRGNNANNNNNNNEYRLNEQIRVPEVRIVGDNIEETFQNLGITHDNGVIPTRKALEIAERLALDLVEISPTAKPPVCRIMDYKKFLYERKKRDKELKAKQSKVVIKEIRFGPNTDDHDFEFKLKHAINFLEEGAKVKAYVQFKGRAIVFKSQGEDLLNRFLAGLEDYGVAEYPPKMEDRRMHCTIAPKKGGKKKDKKDENSEE